MKHRRLQSTHISRAEALELLVIDRFEQLTQAKTQHPAALLCCNSDAVTAAHGPVGVARSIGIALGQQLQPAWACGGALFVINIKCLHLAIELSLEALHPIICLLLLVLLGIIFP